MLVREHMYEIIKKARVKTQVDVTCACMTCSIDKCRMNLNQTCQILVSHAWYFKFVEFPEILQALATPLIANKLSKVAKLCSVDSQIMTNTFYTRNNWRAEAGDMAPMITNKDV